MMPLPNRTRFTIFPQVRPESPYSLYEPKRPVTPVHQRAGSEGFSLGLTLHDDPGQASQSPDLPPSSQRLSPTPKSTAHVACSSCGTVASKKSIRAHEKSRKCARRTRERGMASPLGKRAADGSLQNPRGEKRPHFVPPAFSSLVKDRGGNGRRKARRLCRWGGYNYFWWRE